MSPEIEAQCPTIAFVAHGGPLEPQAALLAASLHDAYLPRRIVCRTIEPEDRWGALGDDLTGFLRDLDIEMVPSQNAIDPEYPHGNKIAALEGVEGRALFLDSDIMLLAPLSWHYALAAEAAAKPADVDTFSAGGGSWARVWGAFGRETPPRMYTASISGQKIRPYFNAGFILVCDGDTFARKWVEIARAIDANGTIRNKRPWLDQVALPVTFAELGWELEILSDAFNFPCHLAKIGDSPPYFAHYHYTHVIENQPNLAFRAAELVGKYPPLEGILRRFELWEGLLNSLAAAPASRKLRNP